MEPDIHRIANLFERPTRKGQGYKVCCPCHHDTDPSLHIDPNYEAPIDQPHVLFHCFAGCDIGEVLASVGLRFSDLYYRQDRVRTPTEREIDEAIVLIGDIDRAQGKKMSREDRDTWVAAKLRLNGIL